MSETQITKEERIFWTMYSITETFEIVFSC